MHSERVEQSPDSVADRDCHHGGGDRNRGFQGVAGFGALGDPTFLGDLLEQIGHPNPTGPPRIDSRFDRGADVVGVDVTVPQTVTADHHDRIPDAEPHVLERIDGRIGGVEQIHHLIAKVRDATFRVPVHLGERVGDLVDGRGFGKLPTGHDVQRRIDQQHEPGSSGVDDPGLGQHRQQLRRARQRVGAGDLSSFEHLDEIGVHAGRCGTDRRTPDHRQYRSLHRLHHGAVGRIGGGLEGLDHPWRVESVRRLGRSARDPPEDLGEDHPTVAPGPHERPVADRGGHVAQFVVHLGQFVADRPDGERHVRSRVAVGHRVDVQPVDASLVGAEEIAETPDDLAQFDGSHSLDGHRARW